MVIQENVLFLGDTGNDAMSFWFRKRNEERKRTVCMHAHTCVKSEDKCVKMLTTGASG